MSKRPHPATARDPNVEEAEVVAPSTGTPTPATLPSSDHTQGPGPGPTQGSGNTPGNTPGDSPMPTIENEARYIFTGGRCSVLDIREILVAQILELQNIEPLFEKGTLRNLTISEAMFSRLSDQAQQWFGKALDPVVAGNEPNKE